MVDSISTPIEPFASKNIATPSDLNEEVEITWEVLKV
jgi:hypothetical protein